jgi:ankyrin repeat protein
VPAPGGARFEGPPSVELDSGIFRLVEQELDPAGSAVIAAVAPASTAEPAEAKLSVRGVADGREVERTIVLRIVDPAYPFGRDADAMTRCLRAGNAKAVANLLRHDPSLINRPSRCCTRMLPLAVAAKTGNIDCIRLLLDNGADVDARSGAHERTALHAAALSGRVEAIRLLLGAEADAAALDRWEMTPLHCAAWGARPECGEAAKLLLDSGAPGDAWTAAGLGRLAELTALIEADPALLSKSDSRGRRLLHWAAFRGRDAVVSTILEQKRETESRDSEGRTPLMCAASQGHSSTVALLLAAGAELRATDRLQRTALHWAAVFDRAPTAAVLLDAGAPPDAKDRMERTPVELAEQNGSRRALAVLRERLSTGDKHGSSTGNGTGPIQVPGTGPETQPPDDRVD